MRSSIRIFGVIILLGLSVSTLCADSLWSDSFAGYLGGGSSFKVGDIIPVLVSLDTTLSYEALRVDKSSITLDFSGGTIGDLFSFLPAARGAEDITRKGSQKYKTETRLAATIEKIDDAGNLYIVGSRSVDFAGSGEAVVVSGWINPSQIGTSDSVLFTDLAKSSLSYTLMSSTREDLIQASSLIDKPVPVQPAAETTDTPVTGETAVVTDAPLDVATASTPEKTLDETTRNLILLQYINRIVSLLFQ